ncbi:MAG: PorP/SprF family type IX secretion system membrane protein [Flavobacteriales bacterium]|nr:PorP/SprF family type IX secretion system membrane protein [Flavobacteriales bacterium]
MKKLMLMPMLFFAIHCIGQDLHFSQIYNSPLTLNPALTGLFIGDLRACINFKDQWRSVGKTYRTYAVSYDQGLFKKGRNNAYLGIGGYLFADKAGDLGMGNTRAQINISGILKINRSQMLSGGMYLGYSQNSIDFNQGQWDSQYAGGSYDPSLSSNETTLSHYAWGYGDVGAGVAWYFETSESTLSSYDAFRFNVGLSVNHLNRPKLKYTSSDYYDGERQYMKLIFHANCFIGVPNTDMAFNPSLTVSKQGPSSEILVGTLYRVRFREASKYTGYFKEGAWSIGAHYRVKDAIIPSILFEADNFAVAFSYDVTLSNLQTANTAHGGFEISVRFVNPNPFLYKRSASMPSL